MKKLHNLFHSEIAELYIFEKQLLNELPNIIKGTTHPILREAFQSHHEDTKNHLIRLERICEILDFKPKEVIYQNIQGLMEEFCNLEAEDAPSKIIDAGILSCFKKIKHYKIAIYAVAYSYSKSFDDVTITSLLDATLKEEYIINDKLAQIADRYFFRRAS